MHNMDDDLPTDDTLPARTGPRSRARKSTRHVSDLSDDGKIPPTEPQVIERPHAVQAAPAVAFATVTIGPNDLAHSLAPAELADEGAWYWIGLLPGAPSSCVHVAGIAFPRNVEIPFRGATNPLDQERELCDGDVLRLPATKVREIAAKVRLRAVRFSHEEGGEYEQRRAREGYMQRVGSVVRYTSQEEVDAAHAAGRSIPTVAPRQGDLPLSKFVYCVLLRETNPRPRWAGQYDLPASIADVGIELPAPDAPPLPADARVNLARAPGMVPCVGTGAA